MKTSFGPLVVRPAHHERMPGPFVVSRSKDERVIFIAVQRKNLH